MLASVRERLADGRVFAGARLVDRGYWPLVAGRAVALTDDRVVIQRGDVVHVYDAATGATQATWPLQRDAFRAPDETETPPPTVLDAWGDLVVYASGRRIRVLRLRDGYDAIILQGPFIEEGEGSPDLDAAIDETGLFYAVSTHPWSDETWPYGHGRVRGTRGPGGVPAVQHGQYDTRGDPFAGQVDGVAGVHLERADGEPDELGREIARVGSHQRAHGGAVAELQRRQRDTARLVASQCSLRLLAAANNPSVSITPERLTVIGARAAGRAQPTAPLVAYRVAKPLSATRSTAR